MRIARIPSLEMGIYALGRLESADLFPDHEEGARKILIDAKVFLAYQRQLVNLGIQEGRLRRQAEKDLAALRALQQPRLQAAQARLNEAAQLYINAVCSGRQQEYDPEALGFEFTIEQIELRAPDLQPDLFHEGPSNRPAIAMPWPGLPRNERRSTSDALGAALRKMPFALFALPGTFPADVPSL